MTHRGAGADVSGVIVGVASGVGDGPECTYVNVADVAHSCQCCPKLPNIPTTHMKKRDPPTTQFYILSCNIDALGKVMKDCS